MGHGGAFGSVLSGIGLPVLLIAVAAIALPFMATPRRIRSQRRLAISVLLSALGLFLLGGALFAVLYEIEGSPMTHMMVREPGRVIWFLLGRAALTALIWAPLLLLAWFSLSRRIEQVKAEEGILENTTEDTPESDMDEMG